MVMSVFCVPPLVTEITISLNVFSLDSQLLQYLHKSIPAFIPLPKTPRYIRKNVLPLSKNISALTSAPG
jgi:hypothetical protein